MSTQLSHKVSSLSRFSTKKGRALLASKLPLGSTKQIELIHSRISQGLCVECGGARPGNEDFCAGCRSPFPQGTNIGSPVNAWQFFVIQTKPAIPGFMAFVVWREGVYERSGKLECLTWADGFQQATAIAEKKRDRAVAAACA